MRAHGVVGRAVQAREAQVPPDLAGGRSSGGIGAALALSVAEKMGSTLIGPLQKS